MATYVVAACSLYQCVFIIDVWAKGTQTKVWGFFPTVNGIFWPWIRLPIKKRVAPACSASNFTIGGMSPKIFYHYLIGCRMLSVLSRRLSVLSRTPGNGGTAKPWHLQNTLHKKPFFHQKSFEKWCPRKIYGKTVDSTVLPSIRR